MITIAVCDDNVTYSRSLTSFIGKTCAKGMLKEYLDGSVIEFSCARDVLLYLEKQPISILFLDIDMPEINGFELAEKLNKLYPDIIIIFVSSHENFVYSSFEYSPFRFLRKSHIKDELEGALIKAIEKCVSSNDMLTFNTIEDEIMIRARDILYFEGVKNYYLIHTANNEFKCRGTLYSVEEYVKNFDFFRTHSAFIANMENIDRIIDRGNIKMTNGTIIAVSHKRAADFKKAYMTFSRKRFLI